MKKFWDEDRIAEKVLKSLKMQFHNLEHDNEFWLGVCDEMLITIFREMLEKKEATKDQLLSWCNQWFQSQREWLK